MWVRKIVGIDVSNETEVTDIEPLSDGLLAVHAQIGGASQRFFARQVVLATGIEGCGRWAVPATIAEALPEKYYAHTADQIDFRKLAGKAVAVVGAGASAFDNAGDGARSRRGIGPVVRASQATPDHQSEPMDRVCGLLAPFWRSRRRV